MAVAKKNAVGGENGTNRIAGLKSNQVRVLRVAEKRIRIPIKGISSIIQGRMSEAAIGQMEDKQQGAATGPRKPKDPVACYHGATHLMPGETWETDSPRIGHPANGFKCAMIDAASLVGMKQNKPIKGGLFVVPDGGDLVEIIYETVHMRTDVAPNANGNADIRYRPEICGWSAVLTIDFDSDVLTVEQIVNLVNKAGFACGIGCMRPKGKKTTNVHGRWMVDPDQEIKVS